MRKHIILIILLSGCLNYASAQVTIPDINFVNWLSNNGYSQCLNGNQLDTMCPQVLNATSIYCGAALINDLTGIQYFKNLDSLNCSSNILRTLPLLPESLRFLNCSVDSLDSITKLPGSLKTLICYIGLLTHLPPLPDSLLYLDYDDNQVTTLSALPNGLEYLSGNDNFLIDLPPLPPSLKILQCHFNQLSSLPALPDSLQYLDCSYNQLDSIPVATALTYLDCDSNHLSFLPSLPNSLTYLSCVFNYQLIYLPDLDSNLISLNCFCDGLLSLPSLPNSLTELQCDANQITTLPALPGSLSYLTCCCNKLSYLPPLPNAMVFLDCDNNQLETLPELPDSMFNLVCSSNPNLHCLTKLTRIVNLAFLNTAVTCLPNYGNVTNSYPPLNSVPLCTAGNQYDCAVYTGIEDIQNISFKLYPNPASNYVMVDYTGFMDNSKIKVMDVFGRIMTVLLANNNTGTMQIDTRTFSDGMYFVTIECNGAIKDKGKFNILK